MQLRTLKSCLQSLINGWRDLKEWLDSNRLNLNVVKTEWLLAIVDLSSQLSGCLFGVTANLSRNAVYINFNKHQFSERVLISLEQ